nr:substrate-binding domain-containing protein [Helcococcus sueciensis]
MKKILSLLLALVLVFSLVACSTDGNETQGETSAETQTEGNTETDNGSEDDSSNTGKAEGPIAVVSREDGSGTRSAFVEIVGVVDDNDNDLTTQTAIIQDGTGKVIETVSGDNSSIGYISLGSLDGSNVKGLKVDGVEVTPENVLSGEYAIQRPLNIVYKEGSLSDLAQDFVNYIMSKEGQDIAVEKGFVQADPNAKAYEGAEGLSGEITVSGSTSVAPLMEAVAEAYESLHQGVKVVINATGSSAGIKDAEAGVVNIGMASRELKDEEKAQVASLAIAKDGIAVVVSKDNPTEEISLESVKKIFLGEITDWADVK